MESGISCKTLLIWLLFSNHYNWFYLTSHSHNNVKQNSTENQMFKFARCKKIWKHTLKLNSVLARGHSAILVDLWKSFNKVCVPLSDCIFSSCRLCLKHWASTRTITSLAWPGFSFAPGRWSFLTAFLMRIGIIQDC